MNKPTHTPGSWVVEPCHQDQGASLAIVATTNRRVVAIVPYDEETQTVDDQTVDELNAYLIAAAPAMMEALKACLKSLMDAGQVDAAQDAQNAINKAEGREG